MKVLYKLFIWSWALTLPLSIFTSAVVYQSLDRFFTFGVRYNPAPIEPTLSYYINYELDSIGHRIKTALIKKKTTLPEINLFIPHAQLAKLESYMPQSGFEYVKGRMYMNNKLAKAKIKYRGDFSYHWAWEKKSIRVKLNKKSLYHGIRSFNLQSPKRPEQLNNFLGLRLAKSLGLIAPTSELVQVNINNENKGIHILVEQLKEETLRRNNRMPADIYRGELVGKDAFKDSHINSLFKSAYTWDKVSTNNHYDKESIEPLKKLIQLIENFEDIQSQKELSQLLDMEAWAQFSLLETLTQSKHFQSDHNWRLYYDPWKQKITPIIWDPMSWIISTRPHKTHHAIYEIISTDLHKALFKNGDFLRARNKAFQQFFKSGKDQQFLKFMDDTVVLMRREILTDPYIIPATPVIISDEMNKLKNSIHHIFSDVKKHTFSKSQNNYYRITNSLLTIVVQDYLPIQRIRIDFIDTPAPIKNAFIHYKNSNTSKTIDLIGAINIHNNKIIIDSTLLPDYIVTHDGSFTFPHRLTTFPAYYNLSIDNLTRNKILAIYVDRGNHWESIENKIKPFVPRTPLPNKNIGKIGWQLFWDTGNGFNRKESTPPFVVKNITDNQWAITKKIPTHSKKLRVDLPASITMSLSTVKLHINGNKIDIPISSLKLNMMEKQGDGIKSYGKDPFFILALKEILPAENRSTKNISVTIVFNVKLLDHNPWAKRIAQGNIGSISHIYAPISHAAPLKPLVWSGTIKISGTQTIDQPLLIKPGTRLLMGEKASLIIKQQLLAQGTVENPIIISPKNTTQLPWGSIVLFGNDANYSKLSHCKISGGSGLKSDLFEYTAMLSIHDVKNVSIQNCVFKDSKITDDMVHAVYSELYIEKSSFINSFSDALDIDISKAVIVDSLFVNSGNDAIDLMTTQASVIGSTLRENGDKGISVGENSQLLAINNHISANNIGIQAKDKSTALLYNQSLTNNKLALNAYKKNWRYGTGGRIFIAKSVIHNNESDITAGKQSRITLFDSDWDSPSSTKKITLFSVNNHASTASNQRWISDNGIEDPKAKAILEDTPLHQLKQIKSNIRGAYTDAQ